MTDFAEALRERCVAVLDSYLEGGGEAALHSAYELGREAMEHGLGVLDMTAVAHGAVLLTLARRPDEAASSILRHAEPFLLECYSPFEMAHRGASEANRALLRNNERREEEIRRLAYELHDQAGQMLATVHLSLDSLAASLPRPGQERLERVRLQLREVESQMRRISHELRPMMLDDLGLVPALSFLAEGISKRAGIRVEVQGELEARLPAPVEVAFYRAAQEALSNIARHAGATRATIRVEPVDGGVVLRVIDDGVGFATPAGAAPRGNGLGLVGIRERIAPLQGTLDIASRPGAGTELRVTIPTGSPVHVAHSDR